MVPAMPPGYTARMVAVATTPEELNYFQAQELSLPEASRVVLGIPIDPSEDILTIAQQIEEACIANSILTWPEYSTHTFTENSTIYVAYQKQGYQAQIAHLIPIIIGIILIAPIILWFASETFRDIIQLIVFIPIMLIMMVMMKKMTEAMKPGPKKPKEKLPPFEERVFDRLESVGERIARLSDLVRRIGVGASSEITGTASEIGSIARTVRAAPETAMSGYNKAKAAAEMERLQRKLTEYEEHLTPEQLEKLRREGEIVEELRRTEYQVK